MFWKSCKRLDQVKVEKVEEGERRNISKLSEKGTADIKSYFWVGCIQRLLHPQGFSGVEINPRPVFCTGVSSCGGNVAQHFMLS